MKIKRPLKIALGFLALVIGYVVLFMISTTLLPVDPSVHFTPQQTSAAGKAILVTAMFNSLAIAYPIRRSRWHGWKLVAAIALVFYGVYTLLSQIETLAYPAAYAQMPDGMVSALFLSGFVLAIPVSLLAMLLMGKWSQGPDLDTLNIRSNVLSKYWIWKLMILAVLYPIIYEWIGYYVTWRNPIAQTFYGGMDPGSFFAQFQHILLTTPGLLLLQSFRALLWTALALPMIRMLKGGTFETSLTLGFLFASLMGAQLLFPNPYMPAALMRLHMIEISLQNLVFGILMGIVMLWQSPRARHSSINALAASG